MPFDSLPQRVVSDADVLDGALGLLERGWCKGNGSKQISDTWRLYCIAGAIAQSAATLAGQLLASNDPLYRRALGLVAAEIGVDRPGQVMGWNDQRQREKDEVLAVVRRAREKCDAV